MALVKCPECGRENVSSTAKSCPGCGYNIKTYYESQQQTETVSNPVAPDNKINVKAIVGVVAACFVIFCIYYFSTRCAYDGCTEKKTSNSKYCAYHSLSSSYGYSSYDYTPKTGNAGAEAKAESYLRSSAFSYTGLIHQLEYEGFSTSEATYGAEAKAESYLRSSAFSYTGLIDQLEYNGFSESEATYGADHCGADWKEQALKKAKSYLNSSAFSYSGLQHQLEYEGFTEEEAQYSVDNCNADWNEQAYKKAKSYLHSSPDMGRDRLLHQLQYEGFSYEQAIYGVNQAGL